LRAETLHPFETLRLSDRPSADKVPLAEFVTQPNVSVPEKLRPLNTPRVVPAPDEPLIVPVKELPPADR
tara:strand:- start:8 stop:214 length:207 start_codon:yes stop_codon:yes gene_type:complete